MGQPGAMSAEGIVDQQAVVGLTAVPVAGQVGVGLEQVSPAPLVAVFAVAQKHAGVAEMAQPAVHLVGVAPNERRLLEGTGRDPAIGQT